MIALFVFVLLGILLGTFSGLVPGIHVNTISLAILGFSAFLNPVYLAVVIIATSVAHTFWDFIPSILLGAPSDDTALAVLPGHKLLLCGQGVDAIRLTVIGGIGAVALAALMLPLFLLVLPALYTAVQNYIHILLATVALYMAWIEKGIKKLYAVFVFLLSGALGFIVLNMPVIPTSLSLFPLFTGLFGISGLVVSLGKKTKIPKQKKPRPIPGRFAFRGVLKGLFSGALAGTLPALGASQATILSQQISKGSNREFLVSIGAINTVVAVFSLISLYTISKPRSGAAVAVSELIPLFGYGELLLLLGVALVAAGVSAYLVLKSAKPVTAFMARTDYKRVTLATIMLLTALVGVLSGLFGLVILAVSSFTGLAGILLGVKRSMMMGSLMLPIMLFYAGFV